MKNGVNINSRVGLGAELLSC